MSFKSCTSIENYKIKFSSLYSMIVKFSIPRYFKKILAFKLKYNKIDIKKQPVVAKKKKMIMKFMSMRELL